MIKLGAKAGTKAEARADGMEKVCIYIPCLACIFHPLQIRTCPNDCFVMEISGKSGGKGSSVKPSGKGGGGKSATRSGKGGVGRGAGNVLS